MGILRDRLRRLQRDEAEQNGPEHRSGVAPHAFADAFSGWLPEAPPASRFKTLRQLFVDTAEAAIGKNRHHVSRPHFGRYSLYDSISVGNDARVPSAFLQVGDESGDVHPLRLGNGFRLEYAGHHNLIRQRQAPGQFILKNVAPQGVGPGLQNRPKARRGIARTQRA